MILVLARGRLDAETWAKANGHRLADRRARRRKDSTLYVHTSDSFRGHSLTSADRIVILPGFTDRPNAERIEEALKVCGLHDPNGGPSWETSD